MHLSMQVLVEKRSDASIPQTHVVYRAASTAKQSLISYFGYTIPCLMSQIATYKYIGYFFNGMYCAWVPTECLERDLGPVLNAG